MATNDTFVVRLKQSDRLKLGLSDGDRMSLKMTTPVGMGVSASINGVKLQGDLTAEQLGLARASIHTTEEWAGMVSYVPAKGELVIYSDRLEVDGVYYPALKIGDGKAYAADLPFADGAQDMDLLNDLVDQLNQHIADQTIHVSLEDRARWDSKLNYAVNETSETIIFNRE